MKSIPRSYIMEFSAGLSGVNQTAKFKMRQALYEVDLSDVDAARAQIADIMEQIVGASDTMASVMAAGFYDGIREYQTGAALGAIADSGREPDSTKRATYGITSRLVENPDIETVIPLLEQRVGYEIKRSTGRTMYRNGQRDPNKPKFARIPMGGDSCEFCRMLASRGFAYISEKSAGKHDPDHYHDGCRCEVVCSWDKDPRIAGLSEEEYNDRAYGEHRDAYRSWASKDHSQHQANQAAKRKNRYTEDGRLKAGYSGLRIDKQAAYTEADRKKVAARAAAQRGNTQRGSKRVKSTSAMYSPVYAARDEEVARADLSRIKRQKQMAHFEGTRENRQYAEARGKEPSCFTISYEEVAALIKEHAGHGKPDKSRNQKWNRKEICEADRVIGYTFARDGSKIPTSSFKIHYSDNGVHAVPKFERKR